MIEWPMELEIDNAEDELLTSPSPIQQLTDVARGIPDFMRYRATDLGVITISYTLRSLHDDATDDEDESEASTHNDWPMAHELRHVVDRTTALRMAEAIREKQIDGVFIDYVPRAADEMPSDTAIPTTESKRNESSHGQTQPTTHIRNESGSNESDAEEEALLITQQIEAAEREHEELLAIQKSIEDQRAEAAAEAKRLQSYEDMRKASHQLKLKTAANQKLKDEIALARAELSKAPQGSRPKPKTPDAVLLRYNALLDDDGTHSSPELHTTTKPVRRIPARTTSARSRTRSLTQTADMRTHSAPPITPLKSLQNQIAITAFKALDFKFTGAEDVYDFIERFEEFAETHNLTMDAQTQMLIGGNVITGAAKESLQMVSYRMRGLSSEEKYASVCSWLRERYARNPRVSELRTKLQRITQGAGTLKTYRLHFRLATARLKKEIKLQQSLGRHYAEPSDHELGVMLSRGLRPDTRGELIRLQADHSTSVEVPYEEMNALLVKIEMREDYASQFMKSTRITHAPIEADEKRQHDLIVDEAALNRPPNRRSRAQFSDRRCRNGPTCRYLRAGRCNFKHSEDEIAAALRSRN